MLCQIIVLFQKISRKVCFGLRPYPYPQCSSLASYVPLRTFTLEIEPPPHWDIFQ